MRAVARETETTILKSRAALQYQLVRQPGPVDEHTFEIEFLDPAVEAYVFTFG